MAMMRSTRRNFLICSVFGGSTLMGGCVSTTPGSTSTESRTTSTSRPHGHALDLQINSRTKASETISIQILDDEEEIFDRTLTVESGGYLTIAAAIPEPSPITNVYTINIELKKYGRKEYSISHSTGTHLHGIIISIREDRSISIDKVQH